MSSTNHLRSLIGSLTMLLVVAGSARAADPFTLTSATFKDGQLMPRKVANNTAGNANCVGDNVSPQLSWTGVPDGTKLLSGISGAQTHPRSNGSAHPRCAN